MRNIAQWRLVATMLALALLSACFSPDLKDVKAPAFTEAVFELPAASDSGRHLLLATPTQHLALDSYMANQPVRWRQAKVAVANLEIESSQTFARFVDVQAYWLNGTDSLNLGYFTGTASVAKTLELTPRQLAYAFDDLSNQQLYLAFTSPKLDSTLRIKATIIWTCTGDLLD